MAEKKSKSRNLLEDATVGFFETVRGYSEPGNLATMPTQEIEDLESEQYNLCLIIGNQIGKANLKLTELVKGKIQETTVKSRLNYAREQIRRNLLKVTTKGEVDSRVLIESIKYLYARGNSPADIELLQEIEKLPSLPSLIRTLATRVCQGVAKRQSAKGHAKEEHRVLDDACEWLNAHYNELVDIPEGTWLAVTAEGIIARGEEYGLVKKTAKGKKEIFVMYQVPFE